MADSFADLWASSAPPTKPTQHQPQKKPGTAPPHRPQYDAFSILSASQPSSRPVANNQPNDRQSRQPKTTSPGGDAFSTLFTSSLDGAAASRNRDRANMTMAERAALSQQAKAAQAGATSGRVVPSPASSSLWDGLDALARPTNPHLPWSGRGDAAAQDSFDFSLDGAPGVKGTSPTTSPPRDASIENDDWGLSEFSAPTPSVSRSAPAATKAAPESKSATLWDLDDFGSSEPDSSQRRTVLASRSLTGTPGDFDFGDREDGLLGEGSDAEDTFGIRGSHPGRAEDDILGDLGRPVSHTHSPPNSSTSTGAPARPSRTTSPPPHITGQLVEMGFTPVEARAALINTMTDDGFDVQTAAELLLSQASQGDLASSSYPPEHEQRRDRDRASDRDRAVHRPQQVRTDSHTQSNTSQTQLDTTAEKLLSQASEIGRGMFSKANALWKEGKERAVKMYEERAAAAGAASGASTSDGRPRWMRDRDHVPNERQRPNQRDDLNGSQAGFKDDEDEDLGGERREKEQRHPARHHPQPRPERPREVDLFSSDSPTAAYQSPFRRGKPNTTTSLPSTQSPSTSTQATPGPSTSRRPSPRTFTTTITLSALIASSSHKSTGTDAYKRGDFPVALAAYIRALSTLPPGHILRLPILTNVALVRSKVGELRETIKACEDAIVVVRRFVNGTSESGGEGLSSAGSESDVDEKTPLDVGSGKVSVSVQVSGGAPPNGDLPTTVDLAEGLSKAFRRRAEALEGLEKWETARNTWEVVLGADWAGAGLKGEAVKGVGRCRRMLDGGRSGPSAPPARPNPNPAPRPRPKPKSTPSPSGFPPSAALSALRSTHDAQQTEDAARLACKDGVESRLTAWKAGREGNIRALLTSLDETVLWPELGWRKVGMAEVVSKGQVKGAYVRAIARVHPDKLNAGNTTVEQRMVANGVFGTLNEAWNVFQQQQQ